MATEATPWTVMTWNIKGSARPDIDRLADVVRIEDPDVVALQEVRRAQAAALAEALGMRHRWALKHYPYTWLLWWRAEGLAILSPHAISGEGHRIVSTYRRTWSWRRRIAMWATIRRSDGSAVRVYDLHLSPHDDPTARLTEAQRVSALVAEHGAALPVIVAGDFNDDDDPAIIAELPGIEHLLPPPTNPADAPTQRLDHVLVPIDATDVAVTVPGGGPEWAELSDHLPVTVRCTITAEL